MAKNSDHEDVCPCCASQHADGPEMPDVLSERVREAQKHRALTRVDPNGDAMDQTIKAAVDAYGTAEGVKQR